MSRKSLICLLGGLAILFGAVAGSAQEVAGSVQGAAKDADGLVLPGVSVTLIGAGFPAGTVAVTGERGVYRFPAVPPGDYTMNAQLDGYVTAEVPTFRVNLGARLTIDFDMVLDTVAETITVTSDVPLFSITASDTSATISGVMIEKLSIGGGDFTDVVQQAAGANNEDDLLGGISIDGSSGSENRFIIDGVDTTDLQIGTSEHRVPTEFIQEVQVKQGGYMAEYGGSTGGVINAVTKQGGGDFSGDVYYYMDQESWMGDDRPALRRVPGQGTRAELANVSDDDRERDQPGFTLGGPIWKDKMWFFVGYAPSAVDVNRTLTFPDGSTEQYFQGFDNTYATANVSGDAGKLFYRLGFSYDKAERDNNLPADTALSYTPPDNYDIDREQPRESYALNLNYLATPNFTASLRGGHFEYDTRDTGFYTGVWWGPSTASAGTPCEVYPNDCIPAQDFGLASQTPINDGTLFDFFERDYIQLDASYFLEAANQDHEFKGGVLMEDYGNDVLDGYSNTRLLFYIDYSWTDLEGVARRGTYGTYRVLQIATQGTISSENTALFLQDSWRVNDRLTLNLGVRAEEEKIPSYAGVARIPDTAIDFGYGDKIAPRLGFAYDVKGDGRWKAYGSYGIFFDNTKLEMPRGSFGGDKWVDFFYGLETLDLLSIVDSCRNGNNTVDSMPTGCPGEFLFLADRRHPSNDPDDPTIDPNIKPMESNEFTLGVEHLLGPNMTVGARYVHKELDRTIEDVGVVVPGVGEVFYIANPGEGIAKSILGPGFPDQPKAVRDYDGVTLTFRKNYSDNWALNATYTWSDLTGNYSGLSSSDEDGRTSPNVNRFFDSLNGTYDATGRQVYGPLGSDRTHQFKAQFVYGFDFGTFVGVNQRYATGAPITTEYTVSPNLPFHPYGRGDLGRMEDLTQTDLFISHEFRFGNDMGLQLSLNIQNLFDEDAMTNYWEDFLLEDIPMTNEQFFAGFNPEQLIADNGVARDPRAGLPEDFQGRRLTRFGVKLTF